MSIDEQTFSAALVDVRHAYRLLADYQKRCLDMLTLIGQQFPETEFYNWKPSTLAPTPIARTDPRDFWGWNFLPLYQASFLLVPSSGGRSHPGIGDWLVELRITSDTGWDMPDRRIEPDASKFVSVEAADSKLSIMVFKCVSQLPTEQNWFHSVWANTSWPEDISVPDDDGLIYMEQGVLAAAQLDVSIAQMTSKDAVKAFCERAKRLIARKLDIAFAAV
ncbi:hypothetical protein [Rhizobium sp. BK176]|uniref:hypothetical protein n=1 Tax=Rhizobium sp. BK176 TaxID=2587071 RepID=UPI00216AA1FD|nr:hypothetical protein [Rhizobium sp. BK176]MCS4089429.1 hypothetical protein [Rhizobium sp. BK176]